MYSESKQCIDYRSKETACTIHKDTYFTGDICPDCHCDDIEKTIRKRRADKIRAGRERKRMARIYSRFLNNEPQIISLTDSLKVSFASIEFMNNEKQWLKENI